jgi:hypothetical protein
MRRHAAGFLYVADGLAPEVFGVENRDGTRVPLYKFNQCTNQIAFDSRLPELAKIDTTEFKKLLDDPSRKMCMVPGYDRLSILLNFLSLKRIRLAHI